MNETSENFKVEGELDFSILIRGGKGEKNKEIYLKSSTEQIDVNGILLTFTEDVNEPTYRIHPQESIEITINDQILNESLPLKNGDQVCINKGQIIIFFALGEADYEFPVFT